MIITPLDTAGAKLRQRKRRASEANLSVLQRSLLKDGLQAYYLTSADVACQVPKPGCFGIKTLMTNFERGRERASRRAAAGRALKRLIDRGLLEHSLHGKWRLTRAGLVVARRLYPNLKPYTKRELTRTIHLRTAISAWAAAHPRLAGKHRRRHS